ncbi:hypothetical protein Bbelb_282780 [Branchiostoma belcheri]|nr:hypothetical protein Bbelb_282780 [Branchiostoma belcheri]
MLLQFHNKPLGGPNSCHFFRDMKEEIEARICPAPSGPSVVIGKPQKTSPTKRLDDEESKETSLLATSTSDPVKPAAGDLLRDVPEKVIPTAQKAGRSRSLPATRKSAAVKPPWVGLKPQQTARAQSLNSGPRCPRKPSASKPRKEVRAASLSRRDDLKASVVTPKEHLSSLLDADSAKAWVRLKPARARSQYGAAPTPAPRKPSASKPRKPASRTFSHSRLDDLQAEAEVKPEELLRSLCLGRGSTKAPVILKKEKTGRARSLAGPRIPAAVQPRRARSLSMPRIDAKRIGSLQGLPLNQDINDFININDVQVYQLSREEKALADWRLQSIKIPIDYDFKVHSMCSKLQFAEKMPKTRADPVEAHNELPCESDGEIEDEA